MSEEMKIEELMPEVAEAECEHKKARKKAKKNDKKLSHKQREEVIAILFQQDKVWRKMEALEEETEALKCRFFEITGLEEFDLLAFLKMVV